ncbi:MAG TPA: OmpA family protein [Flavobacterium sp.]|jgi:outer membrane protein OmpA-like peptidoglycan-associated protein
MKILKHLILLLVLCPLGSVAQQKLEIYFDFDRHDLNESAIKKLNTWVATDKTLEVLKIYGFCDWKGSNVYNDSLSVKRVLTVYNFLLDNNIEVRPDYEMRGFGENFEQSKTQGENRKVMVVYDYKNEEKPVQTDPAKELSARIMSSKNGDKITLDNINFFNMSPRILPKSKVVLADLLCVMQDNPTLKIEIQGHICCQEDDKMDLSTMRAKAIYNFLISRKINRNRLSYKGFGVSRPIHPIPEKNEVEQYENRRVEIMIVEK